MYFCINTLNATIQWHSMASALSNGVPTLRKSWTQYNDNLALLLYSFFCSSLLSPLFLYYPITVAFVKGRYPSIKEFEKFVWKKRYVLASLLFYPMWLIGYLAGGLGILIMTAAAPIFSYYIVTTEEPIVDCLKKSLLKILTEREIIFTAIAFSIAAIIVGLVACCGIGFIVTFPLATIHFYNVIIHKKLI